MICARHRVITVGLFLVGLSAWTDPLQAYQAVQNYRDLKYPPLSDLRVPPIETVTLDNGIRLFMLEDHKLPLITIVAVVRVGSIYEPADKVGLAALTGEVMRIGGTTEKTGDELDQKLESIAASVKTWINPDMGGASISILKENLRVGVALLADILMNPAFREDGILLGKMQMRSAVSRRNDSAEKIGSRELDRLAYGANSVYARRVEYATIDNITRDDLVAFHRRYFGPNHTMVAAWGDFDAAGMTQEIRTAFESWKRVEPVLREAPDVPHGYGNTIHLVRKIDVNQSRIFLGHVGGRMDDPDYCALSVLNQVLGANFTGRLFRNVRSRQGLAYSVGGSYDMQYDHPGIFSLTCQTKSDHTVRAVRALIDEIVKIRQEEITAEELTQAKESYLNSFIFNFDTRDEVVLRMVTYEYYGYPADFLQKTKRGIEEVTPADVLRAARAHLHPDGLQIVVVGRPEDFNEPLSVLGPVQEIDVTAPPPRQ